jgi:hypothetical protein
MVDRKIDRIDETDEGNNDGRDREFRNTRPR